MPRRPWNIRRDIALALCAMPVTIVLSPSITFAADAPPAPTTQPTEISKDQLEAIIQAAGTTPPAWWDSTPLAIPPTMDLSWARNTGTPDDQHDIRIYLLSDVFPNPDRWKEAAKLVTQSIAFNKDNPTGKSQGMVMLGLIYSEMLQDYARGAYWARKTGMTVMLAHCYIKLGCTPMAVDLLKKINEKTNRDPALIKTWAEAGDLDKALAIADQMAKINPTQIYLVAGEACRAAGKIPQAVDYYNKALAGASSPNENRFTERAKASLDAIKLYDSLDLAKIPDGTYSNESIGYAGPVTIAVNVKDHKILSVKVTQHHEKRFFSSIVDTAGQIVSKQSVKGIDTTSGATITSEAIINASAKALSSAQK